MEKDVQPSKNVTAIILKWIGIATAIVSLILGLNQVNNLWKARQEREIRDKKIMSLIKDAKAQSNADDFETGWKTLDKAHSLNADSRIVQNEQTQFAMLWLRKLIFINTTGKYSDVTSRLLPVLYHAANDTSGKAAADILAHIGWANFLKWREDGSNIKISELFEEAVGKDSLNAYAHAMWGFWRMKQNDNLQNIKTASVHFAQALKDGRDSTFIRLLQLWAFQQNTYVDLQVELFNVVNDMRINHEKLPAGMYEQIVDHAYNYYSKDVFKSVSENLSPQDHLLTFNYLTDGMDLTDHPYRKLVQAYLYEDNGDLLKAKTILEELEANPDLKNYNWYDEISRALNRIKKAP